MLQRKLELKPQLHFEREDRLAFGDRLNALSQAANHLQPTANLRGWAPPEFMQFKKQST